MVWTYSGFIFSTPSSNPRDLKKNSRPKLINPKWSDNLLLFESQITLITSCTVQVEGPEPTRPFWQVFFFFFCTPFGNQAGQLDLLTRCQDYIKRLNQISPAVSYMGFQSIVSNCNKGFFTMRWSKRKYKPHRYLSEFCLYKNQLGRYLN